MLSASGASLSNSESLNYFFEFTHHQEEGETPNWVGAIVRLKIHYSSHRIWTNVKKYLQKLLVVEFGSENSSPMFLKQDG